MKIDVPVSIIMGLYGTPIKNNMLIEDLKKEGFGIREIRLIEVAFSPSDYNDKINYLKHFINFEYWSGRNPLNKNSLLMNQIKNQITKTGFTPIELKEGWIRDSHHKLLSSNPVPLFFQDHSDIVETDEEKKAFKNIKTFHSEGYEPKIKKVAEEGGYKGVKL